MDLSSIKDKIATIDSYSEFRRELSFSSPLTIDGEMFLTQKINKIIDLGALVHKTVKADTDQDLAGNFQIF